MAHALYVRTKMKRAILLSFGFIGCHSHIDSVAEQSTTTTNVSITQRAVITSKVGSADHKRFVQAIIQSQFLELDLPKNVMGTPYALEYFSMSRVAPEIFRIVSLYPDSRDAWFALAKVHIFGDGEYGPIYSDYEKAAMREFPLIFFQACPDWESLIQIANDEALKQFANGTQ